MIRRLRSATARKPKTSVCIITPECDIIVDNFHFEVKRWTCTIPAVYNSCCEYLKQLFVDQKYEFFLDKAVTPFVKQTNSGDFITTLSDSSGRELRACDLKHCDRVDRALILWKLRSYIELAFFGFGGGSTRYAELSRMKKSDLRWQNGTIYYQTVPIKVFSLKTQTHAGTKLINLKLAPNMARVFLLYCVALNAGLVTTKHTVVHAASASANAAFPDAGPGGAAGGDVNGDDGAGVTDTGVSVRNKVAGQHTLSSSTKAMSRKSSALLMIHYIYINTYN
jgi:hypothetical protein